MPWGVDLGAHGQEEVAPSWWQEFRSLYEEFMDWLTDNMVQWAARKQAMAFRLSTVQEEVSGWWEAPMSIHGLGQQDFLLHCDFHWTRDLRETWKEETLALARALQCCVETSGAASQGAM